MPSAPQARGCPVPSPLHCCPTGAPRSTPAGQAHPPYSQRSLTFPQDAVHAIQGMGIAARSKRGRCQGLRFPHVLPPPALPPPGPAAPTPHSLPPQVGRLLDIVLHPARQSRGVSRLYGWLWWGRHLSPCSTELGSAQGCSSFPKDKQQPSRALLGAVPPERLLSFQSWRSPPEPAVIAGGRAGEASGRGRTAQQHRQN